MLVIYSKVYEFVCVKGTIEDWCHVMIKNKRKG
jgi:hypothetical protein